ncbi:hypothetical protein JTB14_038051 [Gonioctena quinquepunctata]|nr:hypothetical protein JTB14_038051 [Gonioctena quinquepunctata]
MHIFSDASEDVYATAIYLRFVYSHGIQVKLVVSRARVDPLKVLTIPKLELSAALLGVRLYLEVTKYLDLEIRKEYFWSDSKIVLHWLQSDKKLQTYVSVRVGEMLEHTEVKQWRCIPSSDNVADDCTRDTPNDKFNSESGWFRGPKFLYSSEDEWFELCHERDNCYEIVFF